MKRNIKSKITVFQERKLHKISLKENNIKLKKNKNTAPHVYYVDHPGGTYQVIDYDYEDR